jgi:hypothetical protein
LGGTHEVPEKDDAIDAFTPLARPAPHRPLLLPRRARVPPRRARAHARAQGARGPRGFGGALEAVFVRSRAAHGEQERREQPVQERGRR